MANSENSKLKILVLYDFFLKTLNPDSINSYVQMGDILEHLREVLGAEFERKSIYSDIAKLNEFVYKNGMTDDPEWISKSTPGGRSYIRSALKDELRQGEAHLIYDAIRTTAFVNTGLCEKIVKINPSYFEDEEKIEAGALAAHDREDKRQYVVVNIRDCIMNNSVLVFDYGYKLGDEVFEKSRKYTSPIGLDWDNNSYYLIAIDNEYLTSISGSSESVTEDMLYSAIRRYRIDRMAGNPFRSSLPYNGPKDYKEKQALLNRYLNNSLNAFQSADTREVKFIIRASEEKNLIKAFSHMADQLTIKPGSLLIRRDINQIIFVSEVAPVPPLYKLIFSMYTFEGVTLDIEDEDIKNEFKSYLLKAIDTLT